jgi:flagellar biosynthesis protein FlhF
LAERCDDDLVLVDTPNRTIRIGQLSCNDILQRLPQVEKILLLPANAQGKSLQATLTDYQSLQVKACVLTKLDECASLGEVISVILQSQLPLAYFSKGQNIPDDIEIARGHQLVTKAVSLLKKDQVATQRSLIRAPMKNHKSRLIRQSLSA